MHHTGRKSKKFLTLNIPVTKFFARFQAGYLFLLLPVLRSGGGLNFGFAFILAAEVFCMMLMHNSLKIIRADVYDIALVTYFILLFVNDASFTGLIRIIQLLILWLTFHFCRDINNSSRNYYAFIVKVLAALIFVTAISYMFSGRFGRFRGLCQHSNTFGGVMLHVSIMLAVLAKITRKKYILLRAAAFMFLIASGSRSGIFGVVLFYMLLLWFYHCAKMSRALNFAVIALCTFAVVFTLVYPGLVDTDAGYMLQDLSRKYTAKNFFSGRQLLWENVIIEISSRPIFGHGLASTPRAFMDVNLSCHNLWLQLTLQSGVVGLVLFVLFLMDIFKDVKRSYLAPEGTVYICCLIFHECFEVSITQNNFACGLIAWFILGLIAESKEKQIS